MIDYRTALDTLAEALLTHETLDEEEILQGSALGADWETASDETASNGAYVTAKAGMSSANAPPTGETSTITIPFTVSKDSTYYVFALANGPTAQDDSAWWKLDDDDFAQANGMGTVGGQ